MLIPKSVVRSSYPHSFEAKRANLFALPHILNEGFLNILHPVRNGVQSRRAGGIVDRHIGQKMVICEAGGVRASGTTESFPFQFFD